MRLPSLQALVGGAGRLCFCHTFFGGGGLRTTLGGGGGVELGGLGGCSFLCLTGGFILDFLDIRLTNFNFKLQLCHAMLCKCCGVLWSRKV